MKLFTKGDFHFVEREATLSDIRAAAKEMGYAVVPLSDLLRCHDTGYWTDEMSEYIEDEQDAKNQKPRFIAHYGGPQPVGDHIGVEVVLRARLRLGPYIAKGFCWSHSPELGDIIAYRVLEKDE